MLPGEVARSGIDDSAVWTQINPRLLKEARDLRRKAVDFLRLYCEETEQDEVFEPRLAEIEAEILETGTYRHTYEELQFGARVAWRNSTRCVGRQYWPSLKIVDCRHLKQPDEIFGALVDYLKEATNDGQIKPMIAVFAPPAPGERGIRIWNDQLIRYAGYRQSDGSVLGDPGQERFTHRLQELGWSRKKRSRFDVLPLAIQMAEDEDPDIFEMPEEAVLEVELEHPDYRKFKKLGLRWHAVPSISNMCLEIGGISYTAAPFNGWYMGAEIGARNLADEDRYDQLAEVAKVMRLNTRLERSLWRDRALVELNLAVLHSFQRDGVKIVDHHTVCQHFLKFQDREDQAGRPTYANWAWVVPPISGSTTQLYHTPYEDVELSPNYFPQDCPWQPRAEQSEEQSEGASQATCPFGYGRAKE